jgi:hypothetical protein
MEPRPIGDGGPHLGTDPRLPSGDVGTDVLEVLLASHRDPAEVTLDGLLVGVHSLDRGDDEPPSRPGSPESDTSREPSDVVPARSAAEEIGVALIGHESLNADAAGMPEHRAPAGVPIVDEHGGLRWMQLEICPVQDGHRDGVPTRDRSGHRLIRRDVVGVLEIPCRRGQSGGISDCGRGDADEVIGQVSARKEADISHGNSS